MRYVVAGFLNVFLASCAVGFDHSHALLDRVLKQRVQEARVNYAALKSNRADLDEYLRACGAVTEEQFKQWAEKEQLAFLINLYNAATLQLIIDHYPVKSIRNIGGLFKGPWKQEFVALFGRRVTLDYIEHGLLRANYHEPRIHFAIVCAANGCPPLRSESYVAGRLDDQLEDQGRQFMRTSRNNRVDRARRTVYLSPIFKWFAEDFASDTRSLIEFVAPYFSEADRHALNSESNWKVRHTDYDWALNDTRRK